jgi:hypothetical protein
MRPFFCHGTAVSEKSEAEFTSRMTRCRSDFSRDQLKRHRTSPKPRATLKGHFSVTAQPCRKNLRPNLRLA